LQTKNAIETAFPPHSYRIATGRHRRRPPRLDRPVRLAHVAGAAVGDRRPPRLELRQQLLGLQLAQRGERLWNQWQAGGSVVFHMSPEAAARRQVGIDPRNVAPRWATSR
jgi:hypothetical protein